MGRWAAWAPSCISLASPRHLTCISVVSRHAQVGRVGPKLPPQRLSALRLQLYRAIRSTFTAWRTTRSLRTRWLAKLEPTLEEGLHEYEAAACSSLETDARAVDKWRGRLIAALPPDHHFVGRAFSFSVTTPELVVEYLMTKYDYHEQGHRDEAGRF